MNFVEARNARAVEPVESHLLAVQAMPPTHEVVVATPSRTPLETKIVAG